MKFLKILFSILFFFQIIKINAQSSIFPKVTGHFGIVNPLVTITKEKTSFNFNGSYSVSMVGAINLCKTEKWGFSLESYSTLKFENGISKMANFTFHPGILYRINSTTTLAGRTAFETSGRYGITPVFNKVLRKNQFTNYYLAIPFPIRAGAEKPLSIGLGVQLGVSF